jgi:FkbM family methyltransferase
MHLIKKTSFSRNVSYFILRSLRVPFIVAKSKQLGLKFKFKSEDVIGRNIYKHDIFDTEVTNALCSEITFNKTDTMLDIGANIGWFSAVFAKQGIKVHALEPDPLNFELLSHNIEINQLEKNITPHLLAASNKKSVMPLYLYPNKNRGRHSLNAMPGHEKIDVKTIPLNDFVTEQNIDIKKIKLMKIDVEGHEFSVLQGARNLLQHIPYLLVEHAPEHIMRGDHTPLDIINLLTEYNYKSFTINKHGLEKIDIKTLSNCNTEQDIFWHKTLTEGT